VARSERFELPTYGFVVRCSIQLSYERMASRTLLISKFYPKYNKNLPWLTFGPPDVMQSAGDVDRQSAPFLQGVLQLVLIDPPEQLLV
jgi:hypothetical protein